MLIKKRKLQQQGRLNIEKKLKTDNKENNYQTNFKTLKSQSIPNKSRQAFAGLVIRKKQNKEKNETIDSLKTENIDLKIELEKLDTNLFNMDLENKQLKHENATKEQKLKDHETKTKENYIWVKTHTNTWLLLEKENS